MTLCVVCVVPSTATHLEQPMGKELSNRQYFDVEVLGVYVSMYIHVGTSVSLVHVWVWVWDAGRCDPCYHGDM